jgi:arsenate reductase
MTIKMWHYAGCDTCRKARKWLANRRLDVELVPIVDHPPTVEELRSLWERSGLPLKKLFNTSGQSYRGGGFKDRLPTMSDEEALAALAADGKLIKRPLLDAGELAGGRALVGFSESVYDEVFSS